MKAEFVMLFSMTRSVVEDNLPAIQRKYLHWDRSAGRTSQAHVSIKPCSAGLL